VFLFAVACALAVPPPASAQRSGLIPLNPARFAGVEFTIEVSGQTDLCTDTDYEFIVEVVRYAIHEPVSAGQNFNWGPAAAEVTGTINGITETQATGAGRKGVFSAHFSTAGTYTLEFTASALNTVGYDQPLPLSVTVTVHECDWYVTTMSIWYHLPFGFRDWTGAVTRRVKLDPDGLGNLVGTGTLDTFAIPKVLLPLCDVTVKPDKPAVDFTARSSNARAAPAVSSLKIDVAYALTHVTTTITCPRTRTVNESQGTVDGFNGTMRINNGVGFGRKLPHILNANGPNNGVTRVIVELVMR